MQPRHRNEKDDTVNTNFVGFPTPGQFLANIDLSRPVNVMVTRKHGPSGELGIALDSTVLTFSQAGQHETVYFECTVNRYQVYQGKVMDPSQKVEEIADQVDRHAKQYLTDHEIIWREALLSMPENYHTLNGSPEFLKWDKENKCYVYQGVTP